MLFRSTLRIAGISYGSEVALEFAIMHPEMVESLMLFNATAATGPWLNDIGTAWNLAINNPEAYYHTAIPVIYSPAFYKKHNEWMQKRKIALLEVFSNKAFTEAMIRLTNSSANYDVRNRLAEVSCPTLIVSGRQDYLTPIEQQRYLAYNIPNSHYVVLEDCGHASMYEQPLLFTSLIAGFCSTADSSFKI